jgi:hypothetical protein
LLLHVTLHGQKEKHHPAQQQARGFKNENTSSHPQLHQDLEAG